MITLIHCTNLVKVAIVILFATEFLPIHDGRDHITNNCKQPICYDEDELLQRNSSQNKKSLEHCVPNITTVNSVVSYFTTATTIVTTATTYNQITQEHGEESGTVHYDAVMCGELDVLCNHTIIDETLPTTSNDTDISNETMVATPPSVSSPEQASENVR